MSDQVSHPYTKQAKLSFIYYSHTHTHTHTHTRHVSAENFGYQQAILQHYKS
jgi:hypothetical protein